MSESRNIEIKMTYDSFTAYTNAENVTWHKSS